MKTKILKHKLFLFFILLGLIVSFNGCSDDDEPKTQTFLEIYDGTKWVDSDESTIYLRLNNNTNKPLEQWVSLSECYYYDFESGNLEIIENSENNLILKYTEEGITKFFTITILGKSLKIVLQENEEEDIMYFQYTTVNVDELEICDLEDFTYVPDDNFEQKLIDLGYDDVLDDYVLTENIKDVVELYVNNLNIKDLTGIEDFENLTVLWCGDNQLTSLDVSNSTSLTNLTCGGNQLTSLDVSNNTSLTRLFCSENQLISLDVSKNTSLTLLRCYENQLTSLDVSNNTPLRELWCGNNQLTSLDVSNNTSLTGLGCSFNQLTSLDISKNISLKYLSCRGNQLTRLDVSNNTSLERLLCYENQLTSLDVSYNTTLTYLGCNSNQISCIKVNESQLQYYTSNWTKDDSSTWSLDCD